MKSRRSRRSRVNMEVVMILAGIIFMIILFAKWSQPRDDFYEGIRGRESRICYNEVNVRTEPTTSAEVAYTLSLGDYVSLTGNVKEYPVDDLYPVWMQLEDGNWIVGNAVMDYAEYAWKFGSY